MILEHPSLIFTMHVPGNANLADPSVDFFMAADSPTISPSSVTPTRHSVREPHCFVEQNSFQQG